MVPVLSAASQPRSTLESNSPATFDYTGSSTATGLTPNQIRAAYGLGAYSNSGPSNGISFGQIPGDGRGQTIAVVDAYDDPNALTDLNTFSTYYGLPTFDVAGGPTFQKFNQNGSTATSQLPGTDPEGPSYSTGKATWEMEESLDIEWAHAMAPMADIDLFEASSASSLYTAVKAAAKTSGVDVVSMSWSGGEFNGETSYDSNYFVTPSGHLGGSTSVPVLSTNLAETGTTVTFTAANTFTTGEKVAVVGAYPAGFNGTYAITSETANSFTYTDTTSGLGTAAIQATAANDLAGGITFLASTGDNGSSAGPQYPACSPNVMAVGGTTLDVSPYSESGWSGSGGGISAYESQPTYQNGEVSAFSTTQRTIPDVSIDADPSTGVGICDSWDFNSTTNCWLAGYTEGGTSLACPLWAGMIAVADEGRAVDNMASLNGKSQTLPDLYGMTANFNDIASGSNGSYTAGPGYDLVTGIGSPMANLLVPELAGYPAVATAAAAAPSSVTATTTNLSVLGAASGGQSTLTYNWAATTVPSGATAPTFSVNGSNAAADTTATFSAAGTYVFTVTITAPGGLSTTSNVSVTVNQTLTTVAVSPGMASLDATATQQFTATGCDQFGAALTTQPAFAWTTTVGTITSAGGLLTAPDVSASGTVTATSGTISGNGAVTVTEHAPTVSAPAAAALNPVTGTTTVLSVQGTDIDPDVGSLVYTWTATTVPGGVSAQDFSFSANGSNAAETTTATFTALGAYSFTVTITDPGGLSATSSVNVTVNQTLTTITVSPGTVNLDATATQQFTATGYDQFGVVLTTQPTFAWTTTVGTISSAGDC